VVRAGDAWKTTGACVDVQPGSGVFLMDDGLANPSAQMKLILDH